uniref:Uncharacterized protein n=1 Tax=Panagrolaimus sp. ES5 TaxID=591445 RepID=A0AC34F8D9_9BILA
MMNRDIHVNEYGYGESDPIYGDDSVKADVFFNDESRDTQKYYGVLSESKIRCLWKYVLGYDSLNVRELYGRGNLREQITSSRKISVDFVRIYIIITTTNINFYIIKSKPVIP